MPKTVHGAAIKYLDSDGKLLAEISNKSAEMLAGELFGAIYNNGRMKNVIKLGDICLNSGVKTCVEADGMSLESGDILKIFLWNSAADMLPLQEADFKEAKI